MRVKHACVCSECCAMLCCGSTKRHNLNSIHSLFLTTALFSPSYTFRLTHAFRTHAAKCKNVFFSSCDARANTILFHSYGCCVLDPPMLFNIPSLMFCCIEEQKNILFSSRLAFLVRHSDHVTTSLQSSSRKP